MSIGFNWFKDIEIKEEVIDYGLCEDTTYILKYIGGGNTSHSAGNIRKVQEILKQYGNIEIPIIDDDNVDKYTVRDRLIDPKVISKACEKFLNNPNEKDEYDMKDRIEWFKELSDEGYYLSYDYE